MAWLSISGGILYYLSLPVVTVLNWIIITILAVLAPFVHLVHHLISAFVMPLKVLAKLETLYIYLGIAATIGFIAGCALHVFSAFLIAKMDVGASHQRESCTSSHATPAKRPIETWRASTVKPRSARWAKKSSASDREDFELLRHIIIEEEDSEDIS